jgi:transposase
MATIQAKVSHGHKYWYIVESRRINGKPRPVVLAYLGKPEQLLQRLQAATGTLEVKSYAHGAVAALLRVVAQLQVVEVLNRHVQAQRPYFAAQPLRHGLTVGMTLVLAALGRACHPTSKQGWWAWAQHTSCEYLLRMSLAKLDSQHFWDQMDSLPADTIPAVELELLRRIQALYPLGGDTLTIDTTNFFTYIATTNVRCTLAQRGHNKQQRHDLRQVGLALVASRDDLIPLFHLTYQGNRNDVTVFAQLIGQVATRLQQLGGDLARQTLVFDRGNNSRDNLARLQRQQLHYVGALRPSDHRELVAAAEGHFVPLEVDGTTFQVYRQQAEIWGSQRTVVVLISQRLRAGQLRGVYQQLERRKQRLRQLQRQLANPRGPRRTREKLAAQIDALLHGQYLQGLITYRLVEQEPGCFTLRYRTCRTALDRLEDHLGLRLLMSDRHDWSTTEIVRAYHSQAAVEHAFRHLKNPHYLAVRPPFHWTDQKLRIHFFTCVLAYQLAALLRLTVRQQLGFTGSPGRLLELLSHIRLVTLLQPTGKARRPQAIHQLETRQPEEQALLEALGITETHLHRPQITGVGVYTP